MLNECFYDKSMQIGQISHENDDGLEMRIILQKLVHPIVYSAYYYNSGKLCICLSRDSGLALIASMLVYATTCQ
jgi:hypothetical protein